VLPIAVTNDLAVAAAESGAPESASKNAPPASAQWLSPFELSAAAADQPVPADRASNKGCLPMPFSEYLQLLDWTGREVRADKRGAIPADLAPFLERLHMSGESWLNLVRDFRRKFRRAAGTPESLRKGAQKRGCRKMQGIQQAGRSSTCRRWARARKRPQP
jgi:hypothetical protein